MAFFVLKSKDFPNRLKRIREMRELTPAGLAEKAGFYPRVIRDFEAGTKKPLLSAVVRLAKVLDVSVEELIGEEISDNFFPSGCYPKK